MAKINIDALLKAANDFEQQTVHKTLPSPIPDFFKEEKAPAIEVVEAPALERKQYTPKKLSLREIRFLLASSLQIKDLASICVKFASLQDSKNIYNPVHGFPAVFERIASLMGECEKILE